MQRGGGGEGEGRGGGVGEGKGGEGLQLVEINLLTHHELSDSTPLLQTSGCFYSGTGPPQASYNSPIVTPTSSVENRTSRAKPW